jgi:subtilisin
LSAATPPQEFAIVGEVNTREFQYMVGQRAPFSLAPMAVLPFAAASTPALDTNKIVEALQAIPEAQVVRVVRKSRLETLSAMPTASHSDIVVVRVRSQEHAQHLHQLAEKNPALLVERDHLLQHLGMSVPQLLGPARSPSQVILLSTQVTIRVQDTAGKPVPGAEVILYGEDGTEDRGQTNAQGDTTVSITGGFLNSVLAMYIKPASDYWEKFIDRPALDAGTTPNTITLVPLSAFPPARFPGDPPAFCGWGQRLMGQLNLNPQQVNGAGARVAIIDSGCDTTHPALTHINIGRDYTNLDATSQEPDQNSWRKDLISHGTHCAGVIAGNGENGHIRGFAPKAEVHILKVFPGGAFNNLVAAINYCIENNIHVVNCSLGSDVGSQLVTQAVQRARQAGVAVFVAAGNSASVVQFPANVPGVTCVSALGQAGNYPDYTYHARTAPDGVPLANGQVYPARFTCHGPEVAVCGPGVGIISSVPGGGYAAWDGTSMADPHVTGLAAVLAAHHPTLSKVRMRDASWVDSLFNLIRAAAMATGLDPQYGGAGLPNITRVLGENLRRDDGFSVLVGQPLPADAIAEIARAVAAALPRELMAQPTSGTEQPKSARPAKH